MLVLRCIDTSTLLGRACGQAGQQLRCRRAMEGSLLVVACGQGRWRKSEWTRGGRQVLEVSAAEAEYEAPMRREASGA